MDRGLNNTSFSKPGAITVFQTQFAHWEKLCFAFQVGKHLRQIEGLSNLFCAKFASQM
jgi:hypothetical protein